MTTAVEAIPELLPCPFCGAEMNYIDPSGGESVAQHPHSEECVLSQFYLWGNEPIAAWNNRNAPGQTVLAALQNFLDKRENGALYLTHHSMDTSKMELVAMIEGLMGNALDGREVCGCDGYYDSGCEKCAPPAPTASPASGVGVDSFQTRVDDWLIACFGEEIARDKSERNHRFIEEALELVQSNGCTASEAHQLVDYVFSRPIGELKQEVGGVMNTLAALCLAKGISMDECGEMELARVWTKVEKIRAKQAAKPKHSPLPEHVPSPEQGAVVRELVEVLKLHVTYEAMPADRGGKSGPKGRAWQAFIDARDAALAKIGGTTDGNS